MKSVLLGLVIGVASLFLVQTSRAQQDIEVMAAGELIKAWMYQIGIAVLASDLCRIESADIGRKAVQSLDRRYRRCVSEQPGWAELPVYMQLLTGAASPSSVAIGSQALAVFLSGENAGKARADGGQAFCKAPWKQVLVPEVTADQIAAQQGQTQALLKYMEVVRVVANYESWGDSPCDSFFPPSIGSK